MENGKPEKKENDSKTTFPKEELAQKIKRKIWKDVYIRVVAIFYFFQGFYQAGEALYITKFLTDFAGFEYDRIALITTLVNIPLFLKMFIGLISDRVPLGKLGRRRPYILIGSLAYIPIFTYMSTLKDYNPTWLILLVSGKFAWVLVDCTLDALTVDITPLEKMGKLQGSGAGGRMFGMAVSTLVISSIGSAVGWDKAILTIGIIGAMQMVGAIFLKESEELYKEPSPLTKVLKKTFSSPRYWYGFIFAAVFISLGGVYNLGTAYLKKDLGVSDLKLGYVAFIFGLTAALGAVISGFMCDKYGTKKVVKFLSISHWILILPWIFVRNDSSAFLVYLSAATIGLSYGALRPPTYRISMELCPPEIEGFMFSTLMSFANIGDFAIAVQIVGLFTNYIHITYAFYTLIPMAIIAVLILPKLDVWEPDKSKDGKNGK